MKNLILGTLLTVVSLSANAGDKGNGGGAYVCNDHNGYPAYSRLEDFIEWTVYNRLQFLNNFQPTKQELQKSLEAIDPYSCSICFREFRS